MKTVRVGLVGSGYAARFHREALRRVHGVHVELAGITSRRPESRAAFGQTHCISVFEDLASMLPAVDVVDICSPPYVHGDAILAAARAGKGIICEKPLSGYFGPPGAGDEYRGDQAPKAPMLETVLGGLRDLAATVRQSGSFFGYAENYVYIPGVQKEREILEKTGGQILRMLGEESHSGSHSPVYGIWRYSGGGSLMGKACHPLGGALYLKRVEGQTRLGRPIRPAAVTARTHRLTELPGLADKGFIRRGYHDIEDFGMMHVVFEDGTVADIFASELVLGGKYDLLEIFANNHRSRLPISPPQLMEVYNPKHEQFQDIYLLEKTSSREGWTAVAPEEAYTQGYWAEMQDFITAFANGQQPQSDLSLALDTIATIYAAYLSNERGGAEVPVTRL